MSRNLCNNHPSTPTRMRGAAIAGVLVAVTTFGVGATVGAQSDDDAQRIEFAPGTDFGTVSGSFEADTIHSYVLRASAGQTMVAVLASADENVWMSVYAPEDINLNSGSAPAFAGVLPADGDYRIDIGSYSGLSTAPYRLAVYIPDTGPAPAPPAPSGVTERIEFAPGTNNARVDGAVVLGTTDRYLLRADAGQTMAVNVDSVEGNAVVHVWAPDGSALVSEEVTATIVLPVDGDYVVEVASTRGNATYNVSVWIE